MARADMAAGDGKRQEQRRVMLDAQPFQRVVAVRQPDALGALQDAEIDPTATRGAAFNLDLREIAHAAGRSAHRTPRVCAASGIGSTRLWSHLI